MSVLSPSLTGRIFLTTLATAGVFGLVLLASSSYSQTVPAAAAQASLISPLPANLHAEIEGNAIRPFRINLLTAILSHAADPSGLKADCRRIAPT
jgi:hypothetical protein